MFQWKLSFQDIKKNLTRSLLVNDSVVDIDISKATSYLVLESSILGFDDKVLAVRPIGL